MRYALELLMRKGSYLSTVGDHQKVMLFNTPEEAEAFLWKSDCLVRIATRVAPIQISGQM